VRGATHTAQNPHERIAGSQPVFTTQTGRQPPYGLCRVRAAAPAPTPATARPARSRLTPEATVLGPWLLSWSSGSASVEGCGDAGGRNARLGTWPPTVASLAHRAGRSPARAAREARLSKHVVRRGRCCCACCSGSAGDVASASRRVDSGLARRCSSRSPAAGSLVVVRSGRALSGAHPLALEARQSSSLSAREAGLDPHTRTDLLSKFARLQIRPAVSGTACPASANRRFQVLMVQSERRTTYPASRGEDTGYYLRRASPSGIAARAFRALWGRRCICTNDSHVLTIERRPISVHFAAPSRSACMRLVTCSCAASRSSPK
jgi:hypothetical protein